jgi:hypothetical protein
VATHAAYQIAQQIFYLLTWPDSTVMHCVLVFFGNRLADLRGGTTCGRIAQSVRVLPKTEPPCARPQ